MFKLNFKKNNYKQHPIDPLINLTKSICFIQVVLSTCLLSSLAFSKKTDAQNSTQNNQAEYSYSINERYKAVETIDKLLKQRTGTGDYPDYCKTAKKGCKSRIKKFVNYIFDAAYEESFDPWLLVALAAYESNFNPNEETSVGYSGLMRLRPQLRGNKELEFFKNRIFCLRNRTDACQKLVIRQSARALRQSVNRCNNNLIQGFSFYRTGSCKQNSLYGNQVINLRDNLYQRSRNIGNFCDFDLCDRKVPDIITNFQRNNND